MALEITNDVFFDEILRHIRGGKKVRINAKGQSMLPLIRECRDTIILESLANDERKSGSIVLAQLSDMRYVLHRIERIEGEKVILRGDGNPYSRECCDICQLLAEATAVECSNRRIAKGTFRWWCAQHLWPRNGHIRRVLLYVIRRL